MNSALVPMTSGLRSFVGIQACNFVTQRVGSIDYLLLHPPGHPGTGHSSASAKLTEHSELSDALRLPRRIIS